MIWWPRPMKYLTLLPAWLRCSVGWPKRSPQECPRAAPTMRCAWCGRNFLAHYKTGHQSLFTGLRRTVTTCLYPILRRSSPSKVKIDHAYCSCRQRIKKPMDYSWTILFDKKWRTTQGSSKTSYFPLFGPLFTYISRHLSTLRILRRKIRTSRWVLPPTHVPISKIWLPLFPCALRSYSIARNLAQGVVEMIQ